MPAKPLSLTAAPRPAPSLSQRVRAFAGKQVVVVGDLVADHYLYGQTDRVSREAPVLIVRYESSEVKLGGAANAAANARSLGGQVTVIGALGRDEMGRALVRQLQAAGIRSAAVLSAERPTETKTRILAGGTNTTRQQMLRIDRGSSSELSPRLQGELLRRLREAARSADVVVLSDYGAGVVSDAVVVAVRQLAADGLPVIADSRYRLASFTGMTVCKPNEPELEALSGRRIRSEKDFIAAGGAARKALGCQALLVTRGRSGMAVFDERGAELLPVHGAQEAVDVTGAGDTVLSAFSLAVAAGASFLDAARIANVAGARVVQKQGTATVSGEELLAELAGAR